MSNANDAINASIRAAARKEGLADKPSEAPGAGLNDWIRGRRHSFDVEWDDPATPADPAAVPPTEATR